MTILCFEDSNTWGYDPIAQDRFPRDVRWTGVMRKALGSDFLVLEEGLNGRSTVWEDPIEGYKNGHDDLVPCLETHRPLDLVILMLGTNDLKVRFHVSSFDIAQSVAVLIDVIQRSGSGSGEQYHRVASEKGCACLDASTVVLSSERDGIHFEASEHWKPGQALAERGRTLLGGMIR